MRIAMMENEVDSVSPPQTSAKYNMLIPISKINAGSKSLKEMVRYEIWG